MKKHSLILLLLFSCFGPIYADTSKLVFEGISGDLKLNLSDGSIYEGQVNDCLISGKKISCINSHGIYTFQTKSGYIYKSF